MTFNWPTIVHEFDVRSHTILLTLAGSRSYGIDGPTSDYDYTGIAIPPPTWERGPFRTFDNIGWKDEGTTGRTSARAGILEAGREGRIRSLDKFFREAVKCNANVIEALWVRDQDIQHCTAEGEALRALREQFLSKRAARAFGGYAFGQLSRMRNHYGFNHDGPPAIPSRKDFGLPEKPAMQMHQQGAADSFVRRYLHELAPWLQQRKNDEREALWVAVLNIVSLIMEDEGRAYDPLTDNWNTIEQETAYAAGRKLGMNENFIEYLRLEKEYAGLLKKRKDYESWLKNRNPARHGQELKFGYDCKHASHLLRLTSMGQEIMRGQGVLVYRPDRDKLLEVRHGEWPYERVLEEGHAQLKTLYALTKAPDCPLPDAPDEQALGQQYIKLVNTFNNRMNYGH